MRICLQCLLLVKSYGVCFCLFIGGGGGGGVSMVHRSGYEDVACFSFVKIRFK